MRRRNQSGDNTWIFWVIAAGVMFYWVAQSNATSAANLNQTGVPTGAKIAGSTVYNAQGQVIGSITSQGYYTPTLGTTGTATSNPLTGTNVNTVVTPLSTPPPGTTPGSGCQYNASGQLLYCA